jgi:hypothetical protein
MPTDALMLKDDLPAFLARFRRSRRTDAALRRLAHEIGAADACVLRCCIRSQCCRGPWEPSEHDPSVALPFCLMLKFDTELADIQLMEHRLFKLADRIEEACTAGEP